MFPKIKKVEQLMAYFPEYKNAQLPDKKYFYNIMLTIFPDYMKDVIKPPFFKIRKILKPSFLGLQAWFPRNETLIQ